MRAIINTNDTTKALVIKGETNLVLVQNVVLETVRISRKVIFATLILTLLNMVI
ncbi:MAG: hypothetical protein ACI4UX_00645 [Clostridia bacterium]